MKLKIELNVDLFSLSLPPKNYNLLTKKFSSFLVIFTPFLIIYYKPVVSSRLDSCLSPSFLIRTVPLFSHKIYQLKYIIKIKLIKLDSIRVDSIVSYVKFQLDLCHNFKCINL